jgi:ribosomal-protein-alanine N-acetyltransferase
MTDVFLEAGLDENVKKIESLIGLKIPQDWLDEKDLMELRLENYRSDAKYAPWGLRGIGLRDSLEMVGFIGFHSPPDPEYLRAVVPNAIELGYTIFLPHRRQGFAREAITGLLNWAAGQPPLENFVVAVSPTNLASTGLARKFGFQKISEQIDEFDGLEFVYSLAVENFKSTNIL